MEDEGRGDGGGGHRDVRVLGGGSGWAWQGCLVTEATVSLALMHTEERQRRRRGRSSVLIAAFHSAVYKMLLFSVFPPLWEASRSGLPVPFCRRGKLRSTEAN